MYLFIMRRFLLIMVALAFTAIACISCSENAEDELRIAKTYVVKVDKPIGTPAAEIALLEEALISHNVNTSTMQVTTVSIDRLALRLQKSLTEVITPMTIGFKDAENLDNDKCIKVIFVGVKSDK